MPGDAIKIAGITSWLGGAVTKIAMTHPATGEVVVCRTDSLTYAELEALPLDEQVCADVARDIAPCLPEEFLAAYVIRVGVITAGIGVLGAWRYWLDHVCIFRHRPAAPTHAIPTSGKSETKAQTSAFIRQSATAKTQVMMLAEELTYMIDSVYICQRVPMPPAHAAAAATRRLLGKCGSKSRPPGR